MPLGEFFAKHKIASAVAAPAILGVVAVVGATLTLSEPESETAAPQLRSSVTECHDMVTISVAGRGDTPVAGTTKLLVDANGQELPAALSGDHKSPWLDPIVNAPSDYVNPGSNAAIYIAYPANMATYEDAVNTGVANTERVMTEISKACPDTKYSIVGYSEGADVVRRVAMKIGNQEAGADGKYGIVNPDDVVGVVILADAGRKEGDCTFLGAKDPCSNPDNFDQKYQNGSNTAGGAGALPGTSGDFGKLNGRIASFCSDGDLTCAAPKNISLLTLAVNVGRQVNADQLEREGLTPATGMDVAMVLGDIALKAFADIQSQPNWMASNETFLSVLLRVSDPNYTPGEKRPVAAADAIAAESMSPLAYLPQKVFNEIIGLITTNQNTIPVIMSDPYNLTLGPNHSGHHFDYWKDANAANGKPLTSAEYAAAWLTELAKKAQAGDLDVTTTPKTTTKAVEKAGLAADPAAPQTTKSTTTTTTTTTTTDAKADAKAPATTTDPSTTSPSTTVDPTTVAPTTVKPADPAPTTVEAAKPTTTAPTTTTTVAPTTTSPSN
ncbi:cutinase family protein [Nocardia sp. NPDC055321]